VDSSNEVKEGSKLSKGRRLFKGLNALKEKEKDKEAPPHASITKAEKVVDGDKDEKNSDKGIYIYIYMYMCIHIYIYMYTYIYIYEYIIASTKSPFPSHFSPFPSSGTTVRPFQAVIFADDEDLALLVCETVATMLAGV
jgi:hypothetical protein